MVKPRFSFDLDSAAVGPVNSSGSDADGPWFAAAVTGEWDRFGDFCVTVWVVFEDGAGPTPMLGCRVSSQGSVTMFLNEDNWAVEDETFVVAELDGITEAFSSADRTLDDLLPHVAGALRLAPFAPERFDDEYLCMLGDAEPAEVARTAFGELRPAVLDAC